MFTSYPAFYNPLSSLNTRGKLLEKIRMMVYTKDAYGLLKKQNAETDGRRANSRAFLGD